MKIGDLVYKRSRKPFQNGKRVAVITGFVDMFLVTKKCTVPALLLENCKGPVTVMTVRNNPIELKLMLERDKEQVV